MQEPSFFRGLALELDPSDVVEMALSARATDPRVGAFFMVSLEVDSELFSRTGFRASYLRFLELSRSSYLRFLEPSRGLAP